MSERVYQVIIGVLVLVILVGGALMMSKRGAVSSSVNSEDATSSEESLEDEGSSASDASSGEEMTGADSGVSTDSSTVAQGDSVSAVDQGAAKVAIAQSVTLSKLGWVAVRDSRDWILGAERLMAGTHKDVAITLLRATEAGKTYEMVLYADDGDMAFDLHKDSLIKESDGSDVSAAFLTR